MLRLSVEVQNQDIIVRNPETGHSVTHRRMPDSPMLIALDPLRDDPDTNQAKFLAEAWRAAYTKAKMLGWL
jgi:hypothetical protein